MNVDRVRSAVVLLSAVLALGCAAMAVAHAGVNVPVLSRIGPSGEATVPPAVVGFSVAAVVLALVAVGAARRRAWAWALGIVAHALVILGAALPFRGIGSLIGIVTSGIALGLLVSRPGRDGLLTTTT
ncbi:MAG TPA: hypothetical protein VM307_03935 [Egibacteraceae bacterium]|nr:hypothetical protein [Egibacteraceae bacterium]